MGGGSQLLIPAPYSGMSSWSAHQRRKPPSSEPGTDYYMPIGTRLHAPTACRVVGVGGGIAPATGRFVTLDDGVRWYRYLHLSRADVRVGDRLAAGQYFGLSGASGYGSEFFGASSVKDAAMIRRTGGSHVHVTAFRGRGYTFGSAGTVDFHALTGGAVAGGGSSASSGGTSKEWDEMASREEVKRVVLEALGSRPDTVLIHYSGGGRNGIYLAAPGSWHQFTAEEWKQFSDHGMRSGIRDIVPVNDRDFDVLKAIYAPQATAPAALTDAQLAAIVAQINTETKADLNDADLDRIAKAVRGQFAANPLK